MHRRSSRGDVFVVPRQEAEHALAEAVDKVDEMGEVGPLTIGETPVMFLWLLFYPLRPLGAAAGRLSRLSGR